VKPPSTLDGAGCCHGGDDVLAASPRLTTVIGDAADALYFPRLLQVYPIAVSCAFVL
jgi:hypothetical protein